MVVPVGALTNAYAVSASYSGDTNYKPSVSATDTVYATVVNNIITYTMDVNLATGVLYPMDPFTNLTVIQTLAGNKGVTSIAPTVTAGETPAAYVAALNQSFATAKFTNVVASLSGAGVISIEGPGLSAAGSVVQNSGSAVTLTPVVGTGAFTYTVDANSLTHAPDFVDQSTNLTVTQGSATSIAPAITQNETFTAYATALNSAFATAKFTSDVVAAFSGTPTNIVPTSTFTYAFPTSATVDPTTSLTVAQGKNTNFVAPTIAKNETVAAYVTDLNTAFTTAGFTADVVAAVSSTGGSRLPARTLRPQALWRVPDLRPRSFPRWYSRLPSRRRISWMPPLTCKLLYRR